MTPINIIIDNKTVIDDVEACEIQQSEGQYCHSVSLSMKSKTFWTLCDPTTNFGTLRIKVVIGATTYQFLTEERDTSVAKAGVAFTVWGRSKQALLSKPYSETINDTDDTTHPWQTGNTTASTIVAYVIANYCDYSVTVTWSAGDFAVYEDSFSVSNQFPVDVISALANVIGAELVAAADGSLSIEAYSVAEGSSVQSYDDLDDIVQLSESIDYPSGFNAVTVYGYGSGGSGVQSTISAERVIEDVDADNSIYPGREHTVRVYYYHSQGDTPTYSFPEGSCQQTGSGTESITENIQLIFGKGNTSKTNTDGETAVTGDSDIPITTVSTTYSVNYRDYAIRGAEIGTYNVLFYFEDKSAYTVYSFTAVATDSDSDTSRCDSLVIEKVSPDTVYKGDEVIIRIYGSMGDPTGNTRAEGWDSGGGTVSIVGGTDWDMYEEDIIFISGVATITYPVACAAVSSTTNISFVWQRHAYYSMATSIIKGTNQVTLNAAVGATGRNYALTATATYLRCWTEYKVTVPSNYTNSQFVVMFDIPGCGSKSITISVSEIGTQNVVLNISNWSSSTNVNEVDVEIDGAWAGKTDSNGNISVAGIAKGDHTVKLTKDGYLQSDLDDIENSTFTVE